MTRRWRVVHPWLPGETLRPQPKRTSFWNQRRCQTALAQSWGEGFPQGARWLAAGLLRTATPAGRLVPGLHRLDVERDWLLHDSATFSRDFTLKHEALAQRREATIRLADGADTTNAQKEVLDMVTKFLPARYPENFTLDPNGRMMNIELRDETLQVDFTDDSISPLERAGLLLQEDLVLMRCAGQGSHVVQAAFVVFSFGRLLERVGMDLEQIHSNVNGFAKDLYRPVVRFFDKVSVDKPNWRTNFGLTWSSSMVPCPERYPHRASFSHEPKLNTPKKMMMHTMEEKGVGHAIWLKTEYQTIRRLPQNSNYVLFTVRTFVDPLHLLKQSPAAARYAAEGEFKRYLGIDDHEVRGCILSYLDDIGSE